MNKYMLKLSKDIYTSSLFEPNFEYVNVHGIRFMYQIKDTTLTLVFRGTSSIHNVITDKDLYDGEIPTAYPYIFEYVINLIKKYKIWNVVMGGHSLGGSIVQFLSKVLYNIVDVESYTYNAFGDDLDSDDSFSYSKIERSLFNILETNNQETDIDTLTTELINRMLVPKYMTPKIVAVPLICNDVDDVLEIIQSYKSILKSDITTSKVYSNFRTVYSKDIPNTSFKVEIGVGDTRKDTVKWYTNKCDKILYNKDVVAIYGTILTLLSMYKKYRNTVDINVSNYVIHGDLVGNKRRHSIGKTFYYGDKSITKVTSKHGVELFDKYILSNSNNK